VHAVVPELRQVQRPVDGAPRAVRRQQERVVVEKGPDPQRARALVVDDDRAATAVAPDYEKER